MLCNQGYRVSGSDASNSHTLARLRDAGVEVYVGHAAAQVRVRRGLVDDAIQARLQPHQVAGDAQLDHPVSGLAGLAAGRILRGGLGCNGSV